MSSYLGGIQQIGVGATDLEQEWRWYRRLGFDVPVFRDSGEATLMTRYTGGVVQKREAVLAVNMAGGGGLEIWNYRSRTPLPPSVQPQLGDYGIFAPILRCFDIEQAFKQMVTEAVGPIGHDPVGRRAFWLRDPEQRPLLCLEWSERFSATSLPIGGVCGAVIGVSNMQRSLTFYQQLLGFDRLLYDVENDDSAGVGGSGCGRLRRVGLASSRPLCGPLMRFLGRATLELVQALERQARPLFEGRFWGDPGFIHLCFETCNMEALKHAVTQQGYPMTVDSAEGFDMGSASGRFSYIEDPDGTLIEFVETHRLPLVRSLGWGIDLRRRPVDKPLPDWLLKMLRFTRVRN